MYLTMGKSGLNREFAKVKRDPRAYREAALEYNARHGKPKPHTVATDALMSTAVRWEISDSRRVFVIDQNNSRLRFTTIRLEESRQLWSKATAFD
jgi:hypothetical protein